MIHSEVRTAQYGNYSYLLEKIRENSNLQSGAKRPMKNCKQTAEKCEQIFENKKKYYLSNAYWLYQQRVKNA